MKTLLKSVFLILAFTLVAFGQKAPKWPPTTDWYTVQHKGWPYNWSFVEDADASVRIPFPASYVLNNQNQDQWVNQLMTRQVQGDIRGKTVSITFTVNIPDNGGGFWPFNGYKNPEYGTAPARIKLFLIGYDKLYAQLSSRTPNLPNLTQWSVTGWVLPTAPGTYTTTLSAVVADTEWSNVNGQRTGAVICGADVKQIGLSLSGGKWYSVGIGSPQPAESTITILSFTVQ